MKKRIYCLMAAASLFLGAAAQTISVEDFEVLSSGETVSFYVHYAGVSSMTSTHLEIGFPTWITVKNVEAASDWKGGLSFEKGVIGGTCTSSNAFSGEGDIFKVTIQTTAKASDTYPVTISNIRINGETLAITPTFNIIVVDRRTVVLDENSTEAPAAATDVNVLVKRTINANEWSTICLPFTMTAEQCKETFGDDVQIADFDGCETTYDQSEENAISIKVKFNNATAIKANHPYIIKIGEAKTEFTVENVQIVVDGELSVDKDEYSYQVQVGKNKYETHYDYNSFVGTYVAETEVPEQCLFLNGNQFWYSVGNTKMKAFRAYFDFYDVLKEVENSTSRISLHVGDDTTGIGNVNDNVNENDSRYFDLQGRRVEKPGKGIYVRGGKKKVIR